MKRSKAKRNRPIGRGGDVNGYPVAVKEYGGWYYLQPSYMNEQTVAKRKTSIDFINGYIRGTYMKKMYVIDIPESELTDLTASLTDAGNSDILQDIVRESRRIIRYADRSEVSFKVRVGDVIFYCTLRDLSDDGLNGMVGVTFVSHNNVKMISSAHLFIIGDDTIHGVSDLSGTIITAKQMKDAEKLMKSYAKEVPNINRNIFGISKEDLCLLKLATKSMRKIIGTGLDNVPVRAAHGDMEMYLIKKMTRLDDPTAPFSIITSIVEWRLKDVGLIEEYNLEEKIVTVILDYIIRGQFNFPVVDLSKKEFNFIEKYVDKKNYMLPPESADRNIINMTKVITESRFGEGFRYPVTIKGETVLSPVYFDIDPETNVGSLNIVCVDENNLGFFITVAFNELDRFDLISNIVAIAVNCIVDDIGCPSSMDEMDARLPKELADRRAVFSLLYDILSMFIVLYERPERTRIVRETRKIERKPGTKKKDDEPDFVVKRILKTKYEAKVYVEQMSQGQYKDREYTVESWYRKGHWRTYKSGRSVWISECECKRHLPLTDKEIHLKL